jgi:hypothetical protein
MMMLFPFHSCFIQYPVYYYIYRQHTVLYRMIQYYVCMILRTYHQYHIYPLTFYRTLLFL